MRTESETRLQKEVNTFRQNEDDLKRRISQLEQQIEARNIHDVHPPKRARLSEQPMRPSE